MTKTLGDCLLKGGVQGRRFIDLTLHAPNSTIYGVEKIYALNAEELKPVVVVEGTIVETGELYMKNLSICLNHKEAEQH